MGGNYYNDSTRSVRSKAMGYQTKPLNQVFEQQDKRVIHESMSLKGLTFRECRDSEVHPNALPIILGLDFSGSMDTIPHHFIKDGLPTLMGTLIENGVPDAALLFLGVGDHKSDVYPLQAGQFESGDEELDMWLTRSYIEGNGGGNGGESYLLAWEFAVEHVVTDAWEKRKRKGFIFTIGNEPCHPSLPRTFVEHLYGKPSGWETNEKTREYFLTQAQEKYHVYHFNLDIRCSEHWKSLLGENSIDLNDYTEIPKRIAKIISDFSENVVIPSKIPVTNSSRNETPEEEIILS